MQRAKNIKPKMPYGSKGIKLYCDCCNWSNKNIKYKARFKGNKEIQDQIKDMDLINESD